MGLALQSAWKHDGSPFILCTPGVDFTATMKAHGFTVFAFPDLAHQVATPAEDHCPYSETPWPGSQPYPHGMATDLMPLAGGVSLATIGTRILADKKAGHPGLAALKYMNWTDGAGNCWHESWQPTYRRTTSSDRGHIHMSYRTDYVTSHVMADYDPISPTATSREEESMYAIHNAQGLWLCRGGMRTPMSKVVDGVEVASYWPLFESMCAAGLVAKPTPGTPVDGQGASGYVIKIPDGTEEFWGGPLVDDLELSGGGSNTPGNFTITFGGTGTATPA